MLVLTSQCSLVKTAVPILTGTYKRAVMIVII